MSKGSRKRFTKQQRREFNNRPHPEEYVESLAPILDIISWKPVEGIEDFIKNGGKMEKPTINHKCKIIFPDNEPWNIMKVKDPRYKSGEYPVNNLYGDDDFGLNGRWHE